MKAKEIRQRLTLGFGSTLLLMLILQLAGLTSMAIIQERLRGGIEIHNGRMELISNMRLAAKERSLHLYRLVSSNDPIMHDLELQKFRHFQHMFASSRKSLFEMNLSEKQFGILNRQAQLSLIGQDQQERVIELVGRGDFESAKSLLYGKTVLNQDKVFSALDQLEQEQKGENQRRMDEVRQTYELTRKLIFWLSVLVLIMAATIAVVVIRRSVRSEASLYREKEQAHVTLDSIGEGVITTNASGEIIFLNKAAEYMTGWDQESANGKALLDVFAIEPEVEAEIPAENPVLKAIEEAQIVNSNQRIKLLKDDGSEYAIEYTAAPIKDFDDSVTGAVLVFRNMTAVRDMADRLAHQASHDSLTQLINRREFETRMESALKLSRNAGQHHVLAYMDLDLFKVVNDTCGHIAGDELLKQLSGLLHEKVRKTDTLARLGGDEFGILFMQCPLDKALEIIEVLRKAVKEYRFIWGDKSFEIGASIGLVEVTADSGGITEILSAADTACFVAKDLGRNRYHIYQAGDVEMARRRSEMLWMPRIQHALKNGDFELFYQQILQTSNKQGSLLCREILIRMIDEESNFILPQAFLPAAERYDLMPDIDRWVVKTAFSQLKRQQQQQNNLWMINLSGQTLCDGGFYDFVVDQYQRHNIDPDTICFEITETAAVANLSSAKEMMSKLTQKGFHFALDDFGSGLSSFNYLKNLPVEFLKIDGSFVKDMLADPISTAMVESINQIGHVMGLKTIAEFVEDNVTLCKLQRLQLDFLQGYGIHKPEPLNQFSVTPAHVKKLELV